MFCRNCGAEIPDGSKFCTNCGSSQTAPSPAVQGGAPLSGGSGYQSSARPGRPSNYLVLSIIVTVCCCLPFGIAGIVYASKVDSSWNAGRVDEAWENSRKARNWSLWGLGLSVALWIIYVILIAAGVAVGWWDTGLYAI